MRRTRLSACLLVAAIHASPVAASDVTADVTAVHPVGFTDPAAAAATVRAVVGREGSVVHDPAGRRLIVVAPAHVQQRVRAALATLLGEARNVRIEVKTAYERSARRAGAGVELRRHGGEPRLGVSGGASRSTGSGHAVQHVLTVSGSRARLRVAREVPYAEWLWSWGAARGLWVEGGTRWHAVETSLAVEPHVLGDGRILLRVMPRFDYEVGGRRETTDVTELAAEVVVREGEEVDLGSLVRDEGFRERFLLGFDQGGEEMRIRVTVRAAAQ